MAAEDLAGLFGGIDEALAAFLADRRRKAELGEEAAFRQEQLGLQRRQVDIGEAGQQAELGRLKRAEDVSTADRLRSFLGPGANVTEEQAGTLRAGDIPVTEAPIVGPTRPGRDLGSRLTLPADFFERREEEQRGFEAVERRESAEDRARRIATGETRTPAQVEAAAQERNIELRGIPQAQDRGPQLSPEDLEKARTLETLFKLLQQETDLDRKEAVANRISEFLSDNPALAGIFDDLEGGDEAATSALLQGGGEAADGGFGVEDVLNRLTSALGITTATPGARRTPLGGPGAALEQGGPEDRGMLQSFLGEAQPGFGNLPPELLERLRQILSRDPGPSLRQLPGR